MPYDEALAQRIRELAARRRDIAERKMFGGLAFMASGRLACCVLENRMIVRIGEQAAAKHIGMAHVSPMDFSGKAMKAFATIEPEGLRTKTQLSRWFAMAVEFAALQETPSRSPAPRSSKRARHPRR